MTLNAGLATADSIFSALSMTCLVLGWREIRAKRIARHKRLMLWAVAFSAAFLLLFVIRFVRFGFHPPSAGGIWHGVYMALLVGHEPLAVINVPLALVTMIFGLKGAADQGKGRRDAFEMHKEIAQITFPIWLWVGVSGLALFVMLYVYPR